VVAPAHRNNFDALRLLAAFSVLFSHHFSLMGLPQPFAIFGRTLGEVAVEVFFVISGYLILESWLADPNILHFTAKRFLRVYPGLLVVLLFAALVIGPIFTTVPLREYFSARMTWDYITSNLAMHIVYPLPGVFAGNAAGAAVNGSLWTLPYELRWYLYLLIFGVLRLLRWRTLILLLWAVMFVRYFFVYNLDARLLSHGDHLWAEELGIFFVGGMLLHSTRKFWQRHSWMLVVGGLLVSTVIFFTGRPNGALAVVVPILTICIGRARWQGLAFATFFGDLSYGIYIYAFPMQQTVLHVTGNRLGITTSMLVAAAATIVLAFLSWHGVEKRALRLKHWFPRSPARRGSSGIADGKLSHRQTASDPAHLES
jgi:peptidoglycan/LPS O-acetylase OafA/YrhL